LKILAKRSFLDILDSKAAIDVKGQLVSQHNRFLFKDQLLKPRMLEGAKGLSYRHHYGREFHHLFMECTVPHHTFYLCELSTRHTIESLVSSASLMIAQTYAEIYLSYSKTLFHSQLYPMYKNYRMDSCSQPDFQWLASVWLM